MNNQVSTSNRFALVLGAAVLFGAGLLAARLWPAVDAVPGATQAPAPAPPFKDPSTGQLAPPARAPGATPASQFAEPMTPAAREQVARERFAELASNLREEPVSHEWAAMVQSKMDRIVKDPQFFRGDVTKGMTYERECRTSGCRVSFSFPPGVDSDEALTLFRLEMADEFARTAMVPVWKSDGSSEQHIFFAAEGADRLLRRHRPAMMPRPARRPGEGG